MSRRAPFALALLISVIAFIAYSAAYITRYIHGNVNVSPPVVWFEDPLVSNVIVQLYNYNTTANITIYMSQNNTNIVLVRRHAVFYDTFDTNPLGSRLLAQSCTWNYDTNTLSVWLRYDTRSDATWDLWCVAVVNPSYLNISSYAANGSTVYITYTRWRSSSATRTPTVDTASIYLNRTGNWPTFYTIGYRNRAISGATGDDLYANITYWSNPTGYIINQSYLGRSYALETLYMYHTSTYINFSTWRAGLYVNESYQLSGEIPANYRAIPYAVGIGYRYIGGTGDNWFDFGNLLVTVDAPPWYINVTGVPDGWRVVLRNSTGAVVDNVTAVNGLAVLSAVPKQPIYIGSHNYWRYRPRYLIFRNASIEVYNQDNELVINKTFDEVIGGDLYKVAYTFEGVVLSIYSNMSSGFYGMLANATAPLVSLVNGDIGFRSWEGVTSTQNITILSGVMLSSETNIIYIGPPIQWNNKWLALNVTARFETPLGVIYNVKFNFIWWSGEGARAIYRVNLTVVGY